MEDLVQRVVVAIVSGLVTGVVVALLLWVVSAIVPGLEVNVSLWATVIGVLVAIYVFVTGRSRI